MNFYRQFLLIVIFTSIGFTSTTFSQITYKGKIKGIAFSYPSGWSLNEYKYSNFNQQVVVTAPKYTGWLTITTDTTAMTLENLYNKRVISNYKGKPDFAEGEASINGNAAKWAGTFEKGGSYSFKFSYLIVKEGKAYLLDGQGANRPDGDVMSEQTLKEIINGFQIVN